MQELKKEITLFSGIGQLSTTLLGTGLFMIPAITAGIADKASLWSWLILFVAICPIALTFAMLGRHFPNAGGTAHFVRLAFNAKLERSVAWLFLSVIPVGVPAAVSLAASFATPWLPEAIRSQFLAECLTVALLLGVNLLGSKSSSQLQTVIALSLFTLIILFFWQGEVQPSDLTMPSFSSVDWVSVGSALAVMFWCFVGIEAFAHMGEEFKNPKRDFPIAIVLGCFVAGLTYWACSVVVIKFQAYGSVEMETGAIPWITEQLFGVQSKIIISVVAFFACFASVNLYLQSLSRMLWSQARQYKPDGKLAQLSNRGVPANATYVISITLLLSLLFGRVVGLDLEMFVKLANGIFVLIYLLAMLSAVKLLTGFSKNLAWLSLVLCVLVFACLGWAMLYALIIFALLQLPIRKRKEPPIYN
ncbi:putative Amino acid transporter [Vibrio nigripulchritudo SFn27]|uniref:Putative Amino acid transporter n=1 Tax=Vibrio nigripulchritudo TaxID=28173 RepID=U4KHH2_9VIBR|nr:L-methionine/branched-chain amino acid transporter [Vibrio nigripulchritudo]CCN81936.1 putative Amino acid transporter [Vibrio nigripulchritudo BLFn1]CCN90399.1 putative Amino acid transporter [Vibrio nigripulchritudo SFn27]CCN93827.1 putative Amino acid transporter [Vibrio nigripulchritudo ENn2]CCO42855.1 putative Amino acid transporter [Vibrio nigripulchritudo SFn135]CCO55643.1 putative Amino acid transporter [Vibrio nigripulchritudo Wn13]